MHTPKLSSISLCNAFQKVLPCCVLAVEATDYRLEVLLDSYRNPRNQDSLGRCCDRPALSCSQCSRKCDPYFTITATSSGLYTTPVYVNTDTLTFPSSLYIFHGNNSIWAVRFQSVCCIELVYLLSIIF